ncbi:MAG: tRNA-intron lyase [Candidatus Woesearchaeota archaeon]
MEAICYADYVVVPQGQSLYDRHSIGVLQKNNDVHLSFMEAAYLVSRRKITIMKGKKPFDILVWLQKKKQMYMQYLVYKNLRDRGYVVQTGLKFGAEFRVYDKGIKPGQDHAKWIVYTVKESDMLTWFDFSAKNRVAHSTKKHLLIAIVDAQQDITYYEIQWKRP